MALSQYLFVVALMLPLATARINVDLLMIVFNNSAGLTDDNVCCDAGCLPCDHYFEFCLVGSYCATTGVYGGQNMVYFGVDMYGVPNPMVHHFHDLPVLPQFRVVIQDNDLDSSQDIDVMAEPIEVVPAKDIQSAPWVPMTMIGFRNRAPKTSLEIRYRSYCSPNYYGPECAVRCEPMPGCACSEEGEMTCVSGSGTVSSLNEGNHLDAK